MTGDRVMRRRDFITLLAGAAAWPLAAGAQQPERVRRLGVLMGYAENDPQAQAEITAFRQGLQRLGWTGRNLRIAYRWGHGELDRARTIARELIALQPEAVLAASTPAVKALSGETRTVPIVFVRVHRQTNNPKLEELAVEFEYWLKSKYLINFILKFHVCNPMPNGARAGPRRV